MIDTLAESNRLRAVGISPEHAEALVRFVADLEGNLVTRVHFDERLAAAREHLDHRIADMGHKLTIRLGVIMAAGITIIGGMVKWL